MQAGEYHSQPALCKGRRVPPFELVRRWASRLPLSVVRTGSCSGSSASEPSAARLSSVPLHRADRAERGVAVPDVAAEPTLLIEDLGSVRRMTMKRTDDINDLNAE